MTIVYQLWYRHDDTIGGSHTLDPGIYSSIEKGKDAIAFLRDKPGFVDYGIEGFELEPYAVDVTKTPNGPVGIEGMLVGKTFYELWHRREDERGYDHDTLFGIYSSEANAHLGLSIVRGLPQFADLPEGFEILPGKLDGTAWKEGFATIYPGEG